jgi:hypothetical protein
MIEDMINFKLIYKPELVDKPSSLNESLTVKSLKEHLTKTIFSILNLLVFLPFFIPLNLIADTVNLKAAKIIQ